MDGVAVVDPGNQDIFPNERFKSSLWMNARHYLTETLQLYFR